MTLRKLISSIRGMNKMLSTDALITDRVVAAEIKSNTMLLLKRETNLRRLWATDTIFTTFPCLEMQEVSIAECSDYIDEVTIARSKYKIPRIAEGNYQYLIQGVYSLNALGGRAKKIKEISVNRYINLLKLPVIKNEEYFWISNDYLYVTSPLVAKVRLVALFTEDVPNEVIYPDGCDCGNTISDEDWCKNPLDKPFMLPAYLEKQVKDLTNQDLMNTYFRQKTDVSDDGIDGQAININKK
jgi:hypothetical protein